MGLRDDPDRPDMVPNAAALASMPLQELLPALGDAPRGRRRRGMLEAVQRRLRKPEEYKGETVEAIDVLADRYIEATGEAPELAVKVTGDILRAQEAAAQADDEPDPNEPEAERCYLMLPEGDVEPMGDGT